MKDRGFVISADSFLGLTLMAFIIIVSLFYSSQVNLSSWNSIDLINSARDISIVLEKSNTLENSVFLNSSELLVEKLNSTPNNVCFEVSIFSSNSDLAKVIATKSGCTKVFLEKFSVDRSFVVDSYFYLA